MNCFKINKTELTHISANISMKIENAHLLSIEMLKKRPDARDNFVSFDVPQLWLHVQQK